MKPIRPVLALGDRKWFWTRRYLKCVGDGLRRIRHLYWELPYDVPTAGRSQLAAQRYTGSGITPCGSYTARHGYSIDCSSLPGLKRTALPGGMLTSAPVRGLRPMPVFRGRTLKTPKPRSSMRSPCDRAFFMLSKTVSTAISALVLVMPVLFTTSLMMSSLIKSRLHRHDSNCRTPKTQ